MSDIIQSFTSNDHVIYLKLAREIAMDIRPIEDVLATHGIEQDQWGEIAKKPTFQALLQGEIEAWQSAKNTSERVKIKTLSMVEEALPEFYARMHDGKEPLSAKVEVLKTISKFAGIGGTVDGANLGEKLTVTINLGSDHSLKIEKDVTSKVIEHDE